MTLAIITVEPRAGAAIDRGDESIAVIQVIDQFLVARQTLAGRAVGGDGARVATVFADHAAAAPESAVEEDDSRCSACAAVIFYQAAGGHHATGHHGAAASSDDGPARPRAAARTREGQRAAETAGRRFIELAVQHEPDCDIDPADQGQQAPPPGQGI